MQPAQRSRFEAILAGVDKRRLLDGVLADPQTYADWDDCDATDSDDLTRFEIEGRQEVMHAIEAADAEVSAAQAELQRQDVRLH